MPPDRDRRPNPARPREWATPGRAWGQLKPRARKMRRRPTKAEAVLWEHLRRHSLNGQQFRRQFSVGRFIVDFCCPTAKLVIEVDGPDHRDSKMDDRERDEILQLEGYKVLRVSDEQVLTQTAKTVGLVRLELAKAMERQSAATDAKRAAP